MAAPPVHTAEATKSGTMRSAQRLFDTLVSMNATNLINVEICARSTRSFAWKSMEFQTQVYCNVVKWLLCFRWILKTMPSRSLALAHSSHTLFAFPFRKPNGIGHWLVGQTIVDPTSYQKMEISWNQQKKKTECVYKTNCGHCLVDQHCLRETIPRITKTESMNIAYTKYFAIENEISIF